MAKRFQPSTATAVIIANMVGTGVFTSLGFQLQALDTGFPILLLWVLGGVCAFCGALVYAELGVALPRSGGEYNFLSRIYHPGVGFVSGWLSSTIGFAAPTALAAMTFGAYLAAVFPQLSADYLAVALVLTLTFLHSRSHSTSGMTQQLFTSLKVVFILLFCLIALLAVGDWQPVSFLPAGGDGDSILSAGFAVSLIYVSYAYTGWNAATYLTGELARPQRYLPIVLLLGTGIVTGLYLLLNMTFLAVAPVDAMRGRIEVGVVVAQEVFGPAGAAVMGTALAALLISTVSAMIMAGPRVLCVIGEDFPLFRWFTWRKQDGTPGVAIWLQSLLTLAFVLTSAFESILVFAGFALGVSTWLTVLGVFVLRLREPNLPRAFRTWGYPLTPLIYLAITSWALLHIMLERPWEAMWSGLLFLLLACLYFLTARLSQESAVAH